MSSHGESIPRVESSHVQCDRRTDPDAIDERRRWLLQRLAGAVGTITILGVAPLAGGCEISRVNNVGGGDISVDVSSLTNDNDALVTTATGPDGAPILIVRLSADSYRAMSMRCTHLGCTTAPPSGDQIACPCHGSVYALDGTVINGPAVAPLHAYPTTYDAATRVLTVHAS